jgi:hypothetical protein
MRPGDLVKVRITGSEHLNKIAVVVKVSEADIRFPYSVATIMLNDGTCLDGIHPNALEVISLEQRE